MSIKPLYLLADSQLLFLREGEHSFTARIREAMDSSEPKAAYLGASNGDDPAFYSIFEAAMEPIGVSQRRMIPTNPSKDDLAFLQSADIVLLAGGNVEQGWRAFEQNGVKDMIISRRYDGVVLVGVSAGAMHLGLGALVEPAVESSAVKKSEFFRFAPFYISAHEEQEEWWNLKLLINSSQVDARGIGIPMGGGAIYNSDGELEPIRKPLIEFVKEDGQVRESMVVPE
ncbi:MAG TPA: Type 1 glutamine amidotransferase-like domain-containing protein [Candidatus Angelobacter sp.]|jgi:peptidase E|nr:Type 1 glutamine amidotransferase-like domain-containing protein [Candidatus Angelobacter sp.]